MQWTHSLVLTVISRVTSGQLKSSKLSTLEWETSVLLCGFGSPLARALLNVATTDLERQSFVAAPGAYTVISNGNYKNERCVHEIIRKKNNWVETGTLPQIVNMGIYN